MTEQEIRRALAICEASEAAYAAWRQCERAEDTDYPLRRRAFNFAVDDPVTGYAATLRALLEARELLREVLGAAELGNYDVELEAKIRAFLAEGESA